MSDVKLAARSEYRATLFDKLPAEQVLSNYRELYGLGSDVGLAEVRAHFNLEGGLTDALINSTPENRWAVFAEAYTKLYAGLPWLNRPAPAPEAHRFDEWSKLVGVGKRLLEIGPGQGHLVRYLASQGNQCSASEITDERGEKFLRPDDEVAWVRTDGVRLSKFLPENNFDFVISDQVFEHLHPEDQLTHLKESRKILVDGGRYILSTDHRSTGPHDVSRVFGADSAVFMHLCEPDYILMNDLARAAGFRKVAAVFGLRRFGIVRASEAFLRLQMLADRIEARVAKTRAQRLRFRSLARFLLVRPFVWVVMEK